MEVSPLYLACWLLHALDYSTQSCTMQSLMRSPVQMQMDGPQVAVLRSNRLHGYLDGQNEQSEDHSPGVLSRAS